MKRTRVAAAACVLLLPCLAAAGQPAETNWIEQSRQLAQQLGGDLKAELTQAMQQGGPTAAIAVCRTRAPQIAAELSTASGALVGRTALRVRNPANAPDDLQRAVLEQFAGELASGRFESPLEAAFEINRGGQIERNYLRAIPMDAMCLACHGPAIDPGIAAAIQRDYPTDAATGFESGQLRGAFSVRWPATP